jgi:16S rRNA (guanine966-N2)-methyltransferase
MRIIAGKYKHRNLAAPKNESRPTLTRGRETLFNIIQFDIAGRDVLDLFAGSGSLGLEACSRGAASVTFIDSDPLSIEAIRQNCALVGQEAKIIKGDYALSLARLKGQKFSLVFIDPPYNMDVCAHAVSLLVKYDLLTDDAIVVCEHDKDKQIPDNIDGMTVYKDRVVGVTKFSIYHKGDSEQ